MSESPNPPSKAAKPVAPLKSPKEEFEELSRQVEEIKDLSELEESILKGVMRVGRALMQSRLAQPARSESPAGDPRRDFSP